MKCRRSEANRRRGALQVVETAQAALGDAIDETLAGWGRTEVAVEIGFDVAGPWRSLGCGDAPTPWRDAGQVDEARFGRSREPGGHRGAGRRWTDLTMRRDGPAADERARRRPGDEPGRAEVGVDDGVPSGLGKIERGLQDADAALVDDTSTGPSSAAAVGSGTRSVTGGRPGRSTSRSTARRRGPPSRTESRPTSFPTRSGARGRRPGAEPTAPRSRARSREPRRPSSARSTWSFNNAGISI